MKLPVLLLLLALAIALALVTWCVWPSAPAGSPPPTNAGPVTVSPTVATSTAPSGPAASGSATSPSSRPVSIEPITWQHAQELLAGEHYREVLQLLDRYEAALPVTHRLKQSERAIPKGTSLILGTNHAYICASRPADDLRMPPTDPILDARHPRINADAAPLSLIDVSCLDLDTGKTKWEKQLVHNFPTFEPGIDFATDTLYVPVGSIPWGGFDKDLTFNPDGNVANSASRPKRRPYVQYHVSTADGFPIPYSNDLLLCDANTGTAGKMELRRPHSPGARNGWSIPVSSKGLSFISFPEYLDADRAIMLFTPAYSSRDCILVCFDVNTGREVYRRSFILELPGYFGVGARIMSTARGILAISGRECIALLDANTGVPLGEIPVHPQVATHARLRGDRLLVLTPDALITYSVPVALRRLPGSELDIPALRARCISASTPTKAPL